MLLRALIRQSEDTLRRLYPEAEARQMVFLLLEHLIGTQRHTHIIDPGFQVSDSDLARVLPSIDRLSQGEPLQYVTGQAWFYGRPFNVNQNVLIPRPETELLCRIAIEQAQNCGMTNDISILDLCTGSGCIAWTMALELPGSRVFAADISEGALATAAAQNFPSDHAPTFFKADVLSGELPVGQQKFDIILSNPPYVMEREKPLIRSNVLDWEPSLALFVPDDDPLKFYRAIASHASALLSDGGFGIVEINEALGPQTAGLFKNAGFGHTSIIRDLSSRPRHILFHR